jgi:hypothetical protein
MPTMRETKPGVWEVRVFTGTDAGSASPAGRKVSDVLDLLDAWVDQNLDAWASASARDQQSRVRSIMKDKIAQTSSARTRASVATECKTPVSVTSTAR